MGKLKRHSPQVPDGWQAVRLREVADVSFSSVDKKTVDGEVPVELCNYTDVFYNRRIRAGMKLMTATATPMERNTWSLKKGDVLFTKDSETPEEIGIPAYVTEDMPTVLCGYHLGIARPRDGLIDGAYLSETLGSPTSGGQFARIANGVTRFGLTLDATRSLLILLPPLGEQRAIAAVLDSIEEAIECTEAVITATERLRDALLHELLTRGVPGWHSEWRDAPGIGSIPAGWDVVRLGDVAAMSQGGTPRKNQPEYWGGDVPFVTGADLTGFRIGKSHARSFLTAEGLYSGDTVICQPGALLLATRTAVGLAGMATEEMGASQDITCLVANGRVDPDYLCRALARLAPSLQGRSRGTTIQGITRQDVTSLPILIPPLPEQRAIAAMLDRVEDAIKRLREERERLQSLKASAADALLTGRVRAPVGKD